MKAIVHEALGRVALADRPQPQVEDPGDVVVKVTTAGICGSDLHIVQGRDAGARLGTIMGHEFVGTIADAGSGVAHLDAGDRVLAPFSVNCGNCFYCERGLTGRCVTTSAFGFVTQEGLGLQGAQAEYVRVPLASTTLMRVPDGLRDEEVLFLGDVFSTAYSCAEAAEIRAGDVVVVIGCGPVGLMCIKAARLLGASAVVALDRVDYRLEKARSLGAQPEQPDSPTLQRRLSELTEGRGADAVLEAVGSPAALDLAIELARPGAVVSIAGYHTETAYAFPIHTAYRKNLTLKIGRCNARRYMTELLPLVAERKVELTDIVTHTLPLSEGVRGYEAFANHRESALKVVLKP